METIDIHEARTHLSRLVEEAAGGAEILIAKNGVPRARLVSLERVREIKFGVLKRKIRYPDDFDAPLPRRLFEGRRGKRVAGSALEDRRRARMEQRARLDRRRNRHLRLAVDLASKPADARSLIAKARNRVELWRRNKTCSPLYIKRWSDMLALPPGRLAKRMASLGKWEDALFQNSPWSWSKK